MEAVAGVLGSSDVGRTAPLMEAGLDSLGAVVRGVGCGATVRPAESVLMC